VLVFCVGRTDATSVEAAREIDPTYAETLSAVAARGVEVLAYGGEIDVRGFRLTRRVPVRL
jgi:sugar fermentation stimulation protein A